MEEADSLCDRLAIIDHGRILALGTPAQLKASTGIDTLVTISAEGDLDALARLLRRLHPGRHRGPGASTASSASGSRAPAACCPTVVQVADELGVTVTDLAVNEPTLETVFIDLTGKDLRE